LATLSGIAMLAGLVAAGVAAHELRDRAGRGRGLSVRDFRVPQPPGRKVPPRTAEPTVEAPQPVIARAGLRTRPAEYLTVATTGFALGMGGIAFPLLGPLSVIPSTYAATPYLKQGIATAWRERRSNVDLTNVVLFATLAATKSYALYGWLGFATAAPHIFLNWLQVRTEADFARSFGLPDEMCHRRSGSCLESVPASELEVGDEVLIRAGQTVPVDGVVLEGVGAVDTHRLTGEQGQTEVAAGDRVFASGFVAGGEFVIRTEAAGADTLAQQLVELLRTGAQQRDSVRLESEVFADKVSPFSLLAGAAVLPFLPVDSAIAMLMAKPGVHYRIGGPLTYLRASSLAARDGIMMKDCRAFDGLADATMFVFDKTGTLTTETPFLADVTPLGGRSPEEVLRVAASLEIDQPHPIARSLVSAAQSWGLPLAPVGPVVTEAGRGLRADAATHRYLLGGPRLLEEAEVPVPPDVRVRLGEIGARGHSAVLLAEDRRLIGLFEIAPELRPEARDVISRLHAAGAKTAIISGDRRASTETLARRLGIDLVFADTLPQDKADIIQGLQADGEVVCYVGDGINDAAALLQADASVSLAEASRLATEAAQVVLTTGGLALLVVAHELARRMKGTRETTKLLTILPPLVSFVGILGFGMGPVFSAVNGQVALWSGVANSFRLKADGQVAPSTDTAESRASFATPPWQTTVAAE